MSHPYIKKRIGCFKHSKSKSKLILYDASRPSLPQIDNRSSFVEYINSNPKLRTRNISFVNNQQMTNDTSSLAQSSSFIKSQNWKKVSNLFHSLSLLRSFETKNLTKENDIDNDISFYKNHLPSNSKEGPSSKNYQMRNQKLQLIFRDAVMNDKLRDCHILRENFKEEIAYNILYNNSNVIEAIEAIYQYNPDRNIRNEIDEDFIFNTPLEKNGKTLIYLACQEGKEDIVEYFLNKKLNPKVKSKIDKKTYETPLECASRWGYSKIVKLLLSKVKYSSKEIKKVLKMKGLSMIIIDILHLYLNSINRKRVSCFCI